MKWTLILIGAIMLTACGNNGNPNSSDVPPLPQQADQTPVQNTTTDPNAQAAQNPSNSATPSLPPSTAGLNPAHGQPGHRCDIEVGAPLNSKPVQNNTTPTITTTTNPSSVTLPPTTTQTAPGMNPQHGQPGHRCDIAVGAPLNSSPTTTTTTQNAPKYPYPVKPDSTQ